MCLLTRTIEIREVLMPDAEFEHPRLVAIYDALDPDRSDLDAYVGIVHELGAHRVLDIGCGTGVFALLLADNGFDVVGVDPAKGSLDVAQAKAGAERVRWLRGGASVAAARWADLAVMTGNVAQAIDDPADWTATLDAAFRALTPGGHLVFETRDPAFEGWREWNREASHRVSTVPGVGEVESWVELTDAAGPLVSFRWTFVFASDGEVLTSDSTLRFRERDEIDEALRASGFVVRDVREAPDRPGREFVFIAQRPADA